MAAAVRTPLQRFLNEGGHTVSRERIFFNYLFYDLKLAAARREYHLSIFEPEVDRFGYDIVVDDADNERRFQLKSFTASSGTAQWDIRRRLLLPPFGDNTVLGFETSPDGVGLGGGAVVLRIDDTQDPCPVHYLYTDIYLISAIRERLLVGPKESRSKRLLKCSEDFFTALHAADMHGVVTIPRALFVEVPSADALLAMAGFHSVIGAGAPGCYNWQGSLIDAFRNGFRVGDDGYPEPGVPGEATAIADTAVEKLLTAISPDQLAPFPTRKARNPNWAKL